MRYWFLCALSLLAFPDSARSGSLDTGASPSLATPAPENSVSRRVNVIGWPEGKKPTAPEGFVVTKFQGDLKNPRWIYILPNDDILISEAKSTWQGLSANRITLLRDKDKDGKADENHVLIKGLNKPFGMLYANGFLYIANTDSLMRYAFTPGQTKIEGDGEKLLELPAGGYNNHWTRNLFADKDGKHIFITVGSASNNAENGIEKEERRANILRVDMDGKNEEVFAYGLRNPNGLAYEPVSGKLWTVVNERDELGDDLVPDYMTSVQKDGFYGWPYSYFGQNEDPRMKGQRPDLVEKAIKPDYALGAHTATLGLAFYKGKAFPKEYRGGAFVGQRGSWNRSRYAGYRVAFIPFKNGKPQGMPKTFLGDFLKDPSTDEAYGRPVAVVEQKDGTLLVSDDAGNTIWHVSYRNGE
jgi:glucose/arabinose dehydrogenase